MTTTTTVRISDMGGSVGIALPPEALAQLDARVGDELQLVTEDGKVSLCRIADADATMQRQLKLAEQVMQQRSDVLRRLAE